ncbi:MAG: enoyl-CoA hydratase [Glaciimonas sp.]|nr:enoyl-CoA hydratase [Glaciimonas sp.]
MPDAPLLLEITEGIAVITLNRAQQRNTLTPQLAAALRDAVGKVGRTPSAKAVLLRAAGEHFMVGADLNWLGALVGSTPDEAVNPERDAMRRHEVAAIIDDAHAAILGLRQLPQPVVIAVRGAVAGFGFSLACAADLLLAADNARFTVAYNALGASTDGGAGYHLPRLIGPQRAMAMALLNESMDAMTAKDCGLVYRVTGLDELDDTALALARRLSSGPAAGQASIKRLINFSFERTLPEHLQAEAAAFLAASDTDDFAEGVRAFLEKRPPRFGRLPPS